MKIKVNGIELNYESVGEGKSVILLNPNSVHTKLFMKPIAKLFSQDFNVYCVDRRCCGKSTKNCNLTYEESAKDIYEMINELNIDKPVVVGFSGGASVALHLAIKYPNAISKLVLCSGSARKVNIKSKKIFDKTIWYPGKKNADKFWKLVDEAREIDKDELKSIKAETLIVNGGIRDVIPVSEAEYLHSNINNSKILILENEKHCTYARKKYWYFEVRNFIK
ncbi:MAG: alpha/beta hydrolase [Clostridia bacterium]|nr:alpha/beta hydrolase [Clostridia bacterium]